MSGSLLSLWNVKFEFKRMSWDVFLVLFVLGMTSILRTSQGEVTPT